MTAACLSAWVPQRPPLHPHASTAEHITLRQFRAQFAHVCYRSARMHWFCWSNCDSTLCCWTDACCDTSEAMAMRVLHTNVVQYILVLAMHAPCLKVCRPSWPIQQVWFWPIPRVSLRLVRSSIPFSVRLQ